MVDLPPELEDAIRIYDLWQVAPSLSPEDVGLTSPVPAVVLDRLLMVRRADAIAAQLAREGG